MFNITRIASTTCSSSAITKMFSSLTIATSGKPPPSSCFKASTLKCQTAGLQTTPVRNDLMEFFDNKENWGENQVRVGRAWRKEELRIKSNTDLHKLWFVLLKERNMLLTMEHESKEQTKLFPNPERIDKVKESMANLEEVVRERNRAYFELETGEDGERPWKMQTNPLGLHFFYRKREYPIPWFMNRRWQETHYIHVHRGQAVRKFLLRYRERLWLAKRKQRTRDFNHVAHLFKRFPDMDVEAVRKHYPDVDIERARLCKRARGHHTKNLS
ncbi:39S ribosomal protein L47, mitochondrial [Schistocerca americana]|uniref:39S ribosomal protein L47, mitochondrial n=1 Tax=Schistocerca americana TaxID=7009 RepID=UPI001F500603|nr:39S ribosomal protein L47, mitochondrial [Schistocerca americana]